MSGIDISGAYASNLSRWARKNAEDAGAVQAESAAPARRQTGTQAQEGQGYRSAADRFAETLKARDTTSLFEEFQKLARMTEAEKTRARILEKHGLTEDSLKALSEEEREAIEREIAEAIKQQYGLADRGETESPFTL